MYSERVDTTCTDNGFKGVGEMTVKHGLAAIGLFISFGLFSSAQADYELCNHTSYVLRSAVAFKTDNEWTSKGWWTLHPGKCRTVISKKLRGQEYFAYAESVPGHKGGLRYFTGDQRFCVSGEEFTIIGRDDCSGDGQKSVDFIQVNVAKNGNSKTTFSEAVELKGERASIAGVQRLLMDIGYDPGSIDGYLGRKTQRAIATFRKKHGLRVNSLVSEDLVDKLVDQAASKASQEGYSICNETAVKLWAAVGFEHEKQWQSKGWWMVAPGTCTQVISQALATNEFYVYAITDRGATGKDEELVIASGDVDFCTADVLFDIPDKENCDARGYDTLGFVKVETGGEKLWSYKLNSTRLAAAQPKEP